MKKTKKAKTTKKRSSGRTTKPVPPDVVEREPAPPDPRDGKVAPDPGATAEFKAGRDL